MARKTSKQDENLDHLLDEKTVEGFADRLKTKLLPDLIQKISEKVEKSVVDLIGEAIKKQLQPLMERIKIISEENKNLRGRVDQLETQLRSNNLVIHGIPESTFAEAASVSMGEEYLQKSPSRSDTVKAVIECCKSKLGLEISASDITAGYRISGPKKTPRPIVVGFATRIVRDRVYESRKLLRKQVGATKVYINEHLTRTNSEIFAAGRRLFKDRKIPSIWTRNGYVYVKRTEMDKPLRISSLEDLNKFQ